METETIAPGKWGVGAHWYDLISDALVVSELFMKMKIIEEAAKSIVCYGLNMGEDFDDLYDDMCKSFVQNCRNPSTDQKGMVVSTMAEFFFKILVWTLLHMKCVSGTIVIKNIDIEWCRSMNKQKKLEAAWPKTIL